MVVHGGSFLLALLGLLSMHLPLIMAECPLDLTGENFTLAASTCSDKDSKAKCCRYINALVAISVARYANLTSDLGVTSDLSETCLNSISQTLQLYGVPRNATIFCGLGTKIPVGYECKGRTTVTQMLESPKFEDVAINCRVPLSEDRNCKKCLNASVVYLHRLVGTKDNMTLSTCRDATFAALASQVDNFSATNIASCFFGAQGLSSSPDPIQSSLTPEGSPSEVIATGPSQLELGTPLNRSHHSYHLTLVPVVVLGVTVISLVMLVVLILLIRRKSRELEDREHIDKTSSKGFPSRSVQKLEEGPMFRKFSYRETKKATDSFNNIIGRGGFGTVYKAQFNNDDLITAVKRMNKVSEQRRDEFCREIELLARLHHRHLVALRGFCIEKHERFLMYEYMANGSLKDHLHTPGRTPLSWKTRIQIAIDVANALEYLHFYCDPPLCHGDIKSSNILLDENFVAKVADFGLVHASKGAAICFEPANTDIRGTPGYLDPEYAITQELTEKCDTYSYGVLLLEIVTAGRATQDSDSNSNNLIEWAEKFMGSESRLPDLVDSHVKDSFDSHQLHTIVSIVRWCTQREGSHRPSIKQVLRLLYESSDPTHSGFLQAVEDEEYGDEEKGRRSKGKTQTSDSTHHSSDARCLASSSSTSRSFCSRSFLLETGSPQSPATE